MKYVWMTEYQASNIAVNDTENSTLIEPCINIDSTLNKRWFNVDMWRWSNVIFQHPFNFQIQLKFNVDGQR